MYAEQAQQERSFSGSGLMRQKTLREHILEGDDVFASIVGGLSLKKVKHKALCSFSASFVIAGAVAVILEPEIRELLEQGMPLNRKTCPQLFEDAFDVNIHLGVVAESSFEEMERGILHRGVGRFSFSAFSIENFPFFDFEFPVVFCGAYDPDAFGIKGSVHIPKHHPWKNQ